MTELQFEIEKAQAAVANAEERLATLLRLSEVDRKAAWLANNAGGYPQKKGSAVWGLHPSNLVATPDLVDEIEYLYAKEFPAARIIPASDVPPPPPLDYVSAC